MSGRDRVVSTGKRKKKEAEDESALLLGEAKGELTIQQQLQRLLRLVEHPPIQEQVIKRQVLVRDILAGQERKLRIAEGWTTWGANSKREYDPKKSTLSGYEAIWRRFAKWGASKNITHLHEVTGV